MSEHILRRANPPAPAARARRRPVRPPGGDPRDPRCERGGGQIAGERGGARGAVAPPAAEAATPGAGAEPVPAPDADASAPAGDVDAVRGRFPGGGTRRATSRQPQRSPRSRACSTPRTRSRSPSWGDRRPLAGRRDVVEGARHLLNPHNGYATLFYEPNARVGRRATRRRRRWTPTRRRRLPRKTRKTARRPPRAFPLKEDPPQAPADGRGRPAPEANGEAETEAQQANGEAKTDGEEEEEGEEEGEVEELNLAEACSNKEVRWSASELEKMREEYLKVMNGGPIAPADKSAVPCPCCDRRAFKYLRSLEKHVWNEHGVRLTREQLDDFEKQLRAGKRMGGPTPHRRRKEYAVPELITINYDEMYDILLDNDAIRRAGMRVKATKEASEASRKRGDPRASARRCGRRRRMISATLRRGRPELLAHRGRPHRHVRRMRRPGALVMLRLDRGARGRWFCQGASTGSSRARASPRTPGCARCARCPAAR